MIAMLKGELLCVEVVCGALSTALTALTNSVAVVCNVCMLCMDTLRKMYFFPSSSAD